MPSNIFDRIIDWLSIAAQIGQVLPGPIGIGSVIAAKLVSIAQAANAAHKSITGEPIDPAKLHQIDLVQ